jgi:predicted metal-dependent hydrolase
MNNLILITANLTVCKRFSKNNRTFFFVSVKPLLYLSIELLFPMIKDKEELINTLQENIHVLQTKFFKQKEEIQGLMKEKAEISVKLKEKEIESQSLETKLNTLKLAKSLTGENTDMQDAKIKVNNLVREIDKCISLLNR